MRTLSLLPLLTLIAACGDPAGPELPSDFVLSALDGAPVPAAYDSLFFDGENRFMRLLGAHVTVLSNDSAQYRQATDVVERLPDNVLHVWGTDCFSVRLGFRREGGRVILSYGNHASLLDQMPMAPTPEDTLEVLHSGLASWRHQAPTIPYPNGRSWRLTYEEGSPSIPVCPPGS
jgi:hypothetical protein